ncbi:hypothetical protein O6H91_20G055300 [Diphasiastrum complanatum]|uniref:Uncharacterized protein n=1 Tax=Diphasiastrum complanatum TaxID=34168 RepID=A0ACC2AQM7_DIPCM|nr:hypothetical protein O6H91_20G055300 [Diphasiastrum complanatum]
MNSRTARGGGEEEDDDDDDDDVFLQPYPQQRRRQDDICDTFWPTIAILVALCLLLPLVGFVLWPQSPELEVKQWKLNGISIDSSSTQGGSILPEVGLNVSWDLLVAVENPNYVGLAYDSLMVQVLYKDSEIGEVESAGGSVAACSTANVTATVSLQATQILYNVKDLLIDVANRELPLTTYTTINGAVQLLLLKPHITVTVACEVVVDPKAQEILRQDCGLDL